MKVTTWLEWASNTLALGSHWIIGHVWSWVGYSRNSRVISSDVSESKIWNIICSVVEKRRMILFWFSLYNAANCFDCKARWISFLFRKCGFMNQKLNVLSVKRICYMFTPPKCHFSTKQSSDVLRIFLRLKKKDKVL